MPTATHQTAPHVPFMDFPRLSLAILLLALSDGLPVVGQNFLVNGSFEQPALAAGGFEYGVTGAGWRFSPASNHGGSGVTTLLSLFTYSLVPVDGRQVGFLQADGNSLSQSITLPVPGTYELAYAHAGREVIGGELTYSVMLDSQVLGSFSTATGQSFTPVTLRFDAAGGDHTLGFFATATGPNGFDHTAFFDGMSLMQVPEPATLALVVSGLGLVLFVSRRRSV